MANQRGPMNLLDEMLGSLQGDFMSGLHISEDRRTVTVKLLRTQFDIVFEHPNPQTAAEIKQREGAAYAIPLRIRLVNSNSGKDVRGFDHKYLNPWWIRRFVFDLAAAVAWIEREWDVMSPEFVAKMEKDS
jgi:hypothetical protein